MTVSRAFRQPRRIAAVFWERKFIEDRTELERYHVIKDWHYLGYIDISPKTLNESVDNFFKVLLQMAEKE